MKVSQRFMVLTSVDTLFPFTDQVITTLGIFTPMWQTLIPTSDCHLKSTSDEQVHNVWSWPLSVILFSALSPLFHWVFLNMWPYLGPGSRYCPNDPRYATLHHAHCIMKAHQQTQMTPWGYGVGYKQISLSGTNSCERRCDRTFS